MNETFLVKKRTLLWGEEGPPVVRSLARARALTATRPRHLWPLSHRHGHARPRSRRLLPRPLRSRRRIPLHVLHLPPRPRPGSSAGGRGANLVSSTREPSAASWRASHRPAPRQLRCWRRSRRPLRGLLRDNWCLAHVTHPTCISTALFWQAVVVGMPLVTES